MGLLNWNQTAQNYKIVIDNTPWPEALDPDNTIRYSQQMIDGVQKKGKYDSDIDLIIQQNFHETNAHAKLIWYLTILTLILVVGLIVSIYIYLGLKKKYELLSIKNIGKNEESNQENLLDKKEQKSSRSKQKKSKKDIKSKT